MVQKTLEELALLIGDKKVNTQGLYVKAENRKNREIMKGDDHSTTRLDYLSKTLIKYINDRDMENTVFDVGFSEAKKILGLDDTIGLPTYFRKVLVPCNEGDLYSILSELPKEFPDEEIYMNIIKQEILIEGKTTPSFLVGQTRIYQRPEGIQLCTAYQIKNTDTIKENNPGFKRHLEDSKQIALVANDIYDVLREKKLLQN